MDDDRMKKYTDREIRWANRAIDQFSFFNNLLLTLSVAFLAFFYKDLSSKKIHFTIPNIDWSLTLLLFSMIFSLVAILAGIHSALSRLLDFKLTREINRIRRLIYQYSGIKKVTIKSTKSVKYNLLKRIKLPFQLPNNHNTISTKECEEYCSKTILEQEAMILVFNTIRTNAHNLGLNSWGMLMFQMLCFSSSVILYIFSFISN